MELTINIPQDYTTITLKKYLTMQDELKNYDDNEDAQVAIMLNHLCGIPADYVTKLSYNDYVMIKSELGKFISNTRLPLQKLIMIDGIEYGFEPNLSNLAYGAYLDISKYDTFQIDNNWPKIMSILYRPVLNKRADMYTIKPYTGDIDGDKFLGVSMDVHFGTLFFLLNLSMDLLNATLKSLKVEELPPNIKSALEKSGEVMHHLLNLQTETYSDLKK